MPGVTNYEGKKLPQNQIDAFRRNLQRNWEESLKKRGGVKQWNQNLLAITEGRRTREPPEVAKRIFYSWCGDWVTYHLEQTGCLHGLALNRKSLNGQWLVGLNLTLLKAWAGEPVALKFRFKNGRTLKQRFLGDASSGASSGGPKSWHAWDDKKDECKDGYEPRLGDLVLSPRKAGDHIEFWVQRAGQVLTVSAGAQLGGVAQVKERNLDVDLILGIIDIDGLVTAEPF